MYSSAMIAECGTNFLYYPARPKFALSANGIGVPPKVN